MKRLPVPMPDELHTAVRVAAARAGLPAAEIARRLLAGWLRGDVALPGAEPAADPPFRGGWVDDEGEAHWHSG